MENYQIAIIAGAIIIIVPVLWYMGVLNFLVKKAPRTVIDRVYKSPSSSPATYISKTQGGQIEEITLTHQNYENPLLNEYKITIIGNETPEFVKGYEVLPMDLAAAMSHSEEDKWVKITDLQVPAIQNAIRQMNGAVELAGIEHLHNLSLTEELKGMRGEWTQDILQKAKTVGEVRKQASAGSFGFGGSPWMQHGYRRWSPYGGVGYGQASMGEEAGD